MRLLHKLIPDFLREWDEDLQRSHPRLWSTRVHMHLWFLLLVNGAVFILAMLLQVNTLRFPPPEEVFGYMMVPATIYFAFWVYKVVLFSVNKRFGERSPVGEIGEFLVLWASLFLIWSIPFTMALTVIWRASNLVSDETFTAHIDHLNLNAHAFILKQGYNYYHEYEDHYRSDLSGLTHAFFRDLEEYQARHHRKHDDPQPLHSMYNEWQTQSYELNDQHSTQYDPAAVAVYRSKMDSVELNFPFYFVAHGFFKPAYIRSLGGEQILPILTDSILERIYVEQVRTGQPLDHEAISEALRIAQIYHEEVFLKDPLNVEQDFRERRITDTGIAWSKDQLHNISQAKAWNYFFTRLDGFLPIMIILAFGLALLTSIFKSIYWQPYLIAFVTTGITPILVMILGFIVARDHFGINEGDFSMRTHYLILVATILATVLIARLSAYRTTLAVTTILANVAVPFIALFTLHLLHSIQDIFGLHALKMKYEGIWQELSEATRNEHLLEVQQLTEMVSMWYFWTLWLGIAIYALVLHPLFKGVFARLVALPERK